MTEHGDSWGPSFGGEAETARPAGAPGGRARTRGRLAASGKAGAAIMPESRLTTLGAISLSSKVTVRRLGNGDGDGGREGATRARLSAQ